MPAVKNATPQMHLFPDTAEGRRRSVLFSLSVLTGVLAAIAASTLFAVGGSVAVATAVGGAGVVAFLFAIAVYAGWFADLTDDDQLFWQLAR